MKIIETVSTTTLYFISEEMPGRHAEIYFKDGHFTECRYGGLQNLFSLDDWHFLGLVAQRIGELANHPAPLAGREGKPAS